MSKAGFSGNVMTNLWNFGLSPMGAQNLGIAVVKDIAIEAGPQINKSASAKLVTGSHSAARKRTPVFKRM